MSGCLLNPASSRRTGLLSALLFLLQAGREELRSRNRKSLRLHKGCGDVLAAWTSPSHELGAGTPQEELLLVSPLFSGEIWRGGVPLKRCILKGGCHHQKAPDIFKGLVL